MSSWASITKSSAAEAAAAPAASQVEARADGSSPVVAVIDANALISGHRLESLGASRFVTVPEVLSEVRDAQSRAYLTALPFTVEAMEPSEDSMKAVLRFARETGDIQALSAVDISLLALAHTLEVAAHGSDHLREHPFQPRVRSKHRKSGRHMHGWGTVPNPEDWKAVDEMDDADVPQGSSRIIGTVQALNDAEQDRCHVPGPEPHPPAAFNGDAAAVIASASPTAAAPTAAEVPSSSAPAKDLPMAKAITTSPAVSSTIDAADHLARTADLNNAALNGLALDDGSGEEGDSGWQVGGKSRGAQRKQRRKQLRHDAWLADHPRDPSSQEVHSAAAPLPGVARAQPPVPAAMAVESGSGPPPVAWAAVEQHREDGTSSGSGEEDVSQETSSSDSGENGSEDGGEQSTAAGTAGATGATVEEGPSGMAGARTEAGFVPNTTSSVLSVTADFAMQNVLLQMGLRLVSCSGMQITRLSIWSLRCSACFAVSRDAGRLFCPRCGNMAMERVEVTVGPGGAEYFGVRKKHCLRGTKYSLPKPKGGRSNGPILREDVMMMRMGKKLRRMQRMQEQQAKGISASTVDAFAPEFGPDTWFKAQHTSSDKGATALLAGWKHNPNERKGTRTNRRK